LKFTHFWIVMENSIYSNKLVSSKRCQVSSPGSGKVKEYNCDGKPIILAPCDNAYW
jgi:hypothetical protein